MNSMNIMYIYFYTLFLQTNAIISQKSSRLDVFLYTENWRPYI